MQRRFPFEQAADKTHGMQHSESVAGHSCSRVERQGRLKPPRSRYHIRMEIQAGAAFGLENLKHNVRGLVRKQPWGKHMRCSFDEARPGQKPRLGKAAGPS